MNNPEFINFLLGISILLITGIGFGRLFQRFNIPKVIGELIGGIIIGTSFLGYCFPDFYQYLFPSSGGVFYAREAITKLGIIFLLFIVGLEVSLSQIKQFKKTIAWTSALGSIIPFFLGFASVILLPNIWNYSLGKNQWLLPLFIGTALSLSALPVIARILLDLDLIKSKVGSIIIGTATIDDIVGWLLFAQLVIYFNPQGVSTINPALTALLTITLYIFALTAGRNMVHKLTQWISQKKESNGFLLSITIIMILLSSVFMEKIGVHAILGAFLVGIIFSEERNNDVYKDISKFILSFFSPIYFASIGLQVNFVKHFDIRLVLLVIGIATIGKLIGAGLGARISGLVKKEYLTIGFGVNARGAVEIYLATAAYQAKFIDERIFVAIVTMAVITTIISGPVMKRMVN